VSPWHRPRPATSVRTLTTAETCHSAYTRARCGVHHSYQDEAVESGEDVSTQRGCSPIRRFDRAQTRDMRDRFTTALKTFSHGACGWRRAWFLRLLATPQASLKARVVGAGYVGLVTEACLYHLGYRAAIVDKGKARLRRLREGCIPFYEPSRFARVCENP
jgi:hypothetical protein